jgi:tetratricopeptide (TPR) repeat protein
VTAKVSVVPSPSADEDDLAAMTAALEEELFEDDDEPLLPRESSEQSLEDIFAAFQQHVQQEVGSEDYRTHYDLGIAYKGMGLIEEAVAEFEIAARSGEVRWEALSMIALCRRERNEVETSIAYYRKAIAAASRDPRALASLQYDLAEALLQIGNTAEALDAFRSVLEEDPGYRDVRGRVSELEARVGTP